nr:Uncharacterised protein [Raoultella sp. NCTC 9187]
MPNRTRSMSAIAMAALFSFCQRSQRGKFGLTRTLAQLCWRKLGYPTGRGYSGGFLRIG